MGAVKTLLDVALVVMFIGVIAVALSLPMFIAMVVAKAALG